MNLARLFLALCALFSIATISAVAQDDVDLASPLGPAAARPRIYVGPIGGFNQNYHTGGFASFANDAQCPVFGTGDATGYYVGLSAEFLLGEIKDSRSSIITRLAYDVRPAQFHQGGDEYPSRVQLPDGGDTILNSTTEHVAEIKFSLINLDILYKYMIGNTRLAVTAGPSIGYVLTGEIDQKFNLLQPIDVQFDTTDNHGKYQYTNSDRTIIVKHEDIEDRSTIRLGIKLGLQYEFSVRKFMIVPAVWYDLGITKVTPSASWRVNALQAGVDIRYALGFL